MFTFFIHVLGRLHHSFHAKLRSVDVFGLGQSVGVEEYRRLWLDDDLLQGITPSVHHTERNIRLDGQHSDALSDEHRGVVAGVAVAQTTRWQVERAEETSDKHIRFVHFRHRVVHQGQNAAGVGLVGRVGAEQRACHRHHQRGRNTLSTDVADDEKQFFVAEIEVVEVAAHFLRWRERTENIEVVAVGVGRKEFGQHTHLNGAGDVEFATDAFLFGCDFLQILITSNRAEKDIRHQCQTHEHQQQQVEGDLSQTLENIAVAAHDSHRPTRFALHRRIVNVVFLALFVDDGCLTADSRHDLLVDAIHGRVFDAGGCLMDVGVQNQAFHRTSHQFSRTRNQQVVGRRIDGVRVEEVAQPIERHIGTDHTHRATFGIVDGNGIGAEHFHRANFVEIGFRPIAFTQFFWLGIPFHLMVVMLFGTNLHHFDKAIFRARGVRLEPSSVFRIEIRLKTYGSANNRRIFLDNLTKDSPQ